MALRGIQEYIPRDVNNIARVEDEGNIVSIKGKIFLYPLKKNDFVSVFQQILLILNTLFHTIAICVLYIYVNIIFDYSLCKEMLVLLIIVNIVSFSV